MILGYRRCSLLMVCGLFLSNMPVAPGGEVHQAADLTLEAVAAAIHAAQDGDTVELPAGKAEWTKGWNTGRWTPMKAITLQGAGIDKTIIVDRRPQAKAGDTPFWLKGVEGKPFRVTGITLDGTGRTTPGQGYMMEIGGHCKNFRIDHCKFKNAAGMIRIHGDTYGLIDHCKFEATEPEGGLVQTIHCEGPGFANFTKPLRLGTAEAVYFEDNEVELGPDVVNPTGNNPWVVPCQGARVVIRYNKIINSQLEIYRPYNSHAPGSQSAEVYKNTFSAIGLRPGRPQGFIFIGGGTAIVFDNTVVGTSYNARAILIRNERAVRDLGDLTQGDGNNPLDGNQIPAGRPGAGYPHFGQVGWSAKVDGQFVLTPCSAWGNTFNGKPLRIELDRRADANERATVQEGREYTNERPPLPAYSPYVYPHPLQQSPAK